MWPPPGAASTSTCSSAAEPVVNRPTLSEYVASLGRLTAHVDPNTPTEASTVVHQAADSLDRFVPD